jgi:quinol monooxygenase YgiN
MIVVKIRVEVLPDKKQEFEQAAQWLIESQPKEEGNILKAIYQDLCKPNSYYYLEEWNSRKSFKAHFQSDGLRALLGGMKVLGKITEAKIISGAREEELAIEK